jgi:hypothetical protein
MGKVKEFSGFAGKVVLVHTVTYFVFGLIMSSLLDYGKLYQQEIIRDFMRPIDSSAVFLGPLMQPVRGVLFALGLWPIRRIIVERARGWLILWSLFVVFGILSTPAAAPSSVEGLIYSKLPFWYHLIGLPEIMLQTLAFSLILVWWEKRQYQTSQQGQRSHLWPDILKAVMIASFAYMGYAVGGILSAIIAKVEIDMGAAASDWKTQMMFVVAFVFNALLVLAVSGRWVRREIALWQVFLLFWLIDAIVPLAYQLIFLSPMPLPLALLMAFFPALVIAIGIRFGYGRMMPIS